MPIYDPGSSPGDRHGAPAAPLPNAVTVFASLYEAMLEGRAAEAAVCRVSAWGGLGADLGRTWSAPAPAAEEKIGAVDQEAFKALSRPAIRFSSLYGLLMKSTAPAFMARARVPSSG